MPPDDPRMDVKVDKQCCAGAPSVCTVRRRTPAVAHLAVNLDFIVRESGPDGFRMVTVQLAWTSPGANPDDVLAAVTVVVGAKDSASCRC